MMGHRVKLIDGDEYDAICGRHTGFSSLRMVRHAKRQIRRRERHTAKLELLQRRRAG